MFDNCLFSVHRAQKDKDNVASSSMTEGAKKSHLKIDGINIDHINANVKGPLGWITKGTIDVDLHVSIPQGSDEDVLGLVMAEVGDMKTLALNKIEEAILSRPLNDKIPLLKTTRTFAFENQQQQPQSPPLSQAQTQIQPQQQQQVSTTLVTATQKKSPLLMQWNIKLKNLKASVPLATQELSYLNNALIRPIVAYMNANKTSISLSFNAKMDLVGFVI